MQRTRRSSLPVSLNLVLSALAEGTRPGDALRLAPGTIEKLPGHSRVFRLAVADEASAVTPVILKLTTPWEAEVQTRIAATIPDAVPAVYRRVPYSSPSAKGVGLLMEAIEAPAASSEESTPGYVRALPALAEVHRRFEQTKVTRLTREPEVFRHVLESAAEIPNFLRFLIAAGLNLDPAIVDELAKIASDVEYHVRRCTESPVITLVHRDLQPANVLVAADGTARILDWGRSAIGTPELDLVMCEREEVLAYISARRDAIDPYVDELPAIYARLRSATVLAMFEAIASTAALVFGEAEVQHADGLVDALPFYVERLVTAANSPGYSGGDPIASRLTADVSSR